MLRRCHSSPALLQGRSLRPDHPQPIVSDSPSHQHPTVINGTADIEALTQHLQRGDALSTELRLHLPAHTDAEALARLLAVVDTLAGQGKLTDFKLTVEGSDQGPIDDALREVLANSKACLVLSGETVRPLIFRDLASLQRLHGEWLLGFLDMSLANRMDHTLDEPVAGRLVRLALVTGEDLLLRAVAVLSPLYQHGFMGLPVPQMYERLVRQGIACSLHLRLDSSHAASLIDWLSLPHPLLQAIELDLVESLDADTSMQLWTRLVCQPSIQRVQLDIASGVTIDWLPRTEAALAPTARLNLLRIRLHDRCKQAPLFISEFMEWFQPVNLELRSLWVTSAVRILEGIEPVRQRPMRRFSLVCEQGKGPREPSLTEALIGFIKRWGDHVQEIDVEMQHPLSGPLALKVLDAEAEEGLQLKSVKLTRSVASQWAKHRFEKPLRVALHRGRFFHAYLVGAVEGLLGVADPAIRVIDEKWLSTRDALSLNQMSSQTHQAAILRRRWKQAQALVQAMRNQQLDPPTLRELLMGPMGQLDGDLVAAVEQRLRVTRAGPNAWRLFFEAGAYR